MCEGISTNGKGFSGSTSFIVVGSYAHDSKDGFFATGQGSVVNCVADTASNSGITLATRSIAVNNTIYNCLSGIVTAAVDNLTIVNNIIHSCTTGITSTSLNTSELLDNNVFYNNTTNLSNMNAMGEYDITGDPKLNDAANGDFTLQSGSSALDTGMQALKNIGLTGAYKWNIGIDQDDVSAAPAGGGAGWYAGE